MTSLMRSLLTVTACAALTVLVTACAGASTTVVGAALSSTGAAASASSPGPAATQGPARVVYLAEGGSVGGTAVHAPACAAGCPLSGDGTTSLWDMTWPTWNSDGASGTGTEKLDDCTPNCAAGTLHAVRVAVTLSRPVMACVSGTGKWFWTRVSFTWPDGLPAAFSGGNAPLNPFDFQDITTQSAKSCP
ncbi:MAG: hypothetical protein ACRDP7_33635 [Trebonia sp.]